MPFKLTGRGFSFPFPAASGGTEVLQVPMAIGSLGNWKSKAERLWQDHTCMKVGRRVVGEEPRAVDTPAVGTNWNAASPPSVNRPLRDVGICEVGVRCVFPLTTPNPYSTAGFHPSGDCARAI